MSSETLETTFGVTAEGVLDVRPRGGERLDLECATVVVTAESEPEIIGGCLRGG